MDTKPNVLSTASAASRRGNVKSIPYAATAAKAASMGHLLEM